MANKDDYLTSYREFFENFAQTVNPNDQLPVKLGSYKLINLEVVGGVIDWTTQYLTQKKCPHHLLAPLIQIIIEETRKACKKQPIACGFSPSDNAYEPLKLMQTVMAKTNEVCLRYLDNSMLCSLPSPGTPYHIVSVCAAKNKRRMMEDKHVVVHDLNTMFNIQDASPSSYYAIFDGHAGLDAAAYSSAHLHQFLAESKYFVSNPEQALLDAFCKTDALFVEKCNVERFSGGTTAVCALLRPKEKTLYIAWVGDSQALLVNQGRVLQCVHPHKPCRTDEKDRIEKQGGFVSFWGTWRVNGQLAVSRAIGDAEYKPYVSAVPDIRELPLDGGEDFLILACDGLWDFLSEDDTARTVYNMVCQNPDKTDLISERLVQLSKERGSADNISVIVVFLREPSKIAAEAHWANRNGSPIKMDTSLDNANNPFANSNGSGADNILPQKNDGLLLNLSESFKQNGGDLSPAGDFFHNEKSNGKRSASEFDDDSDLGPETDVDTVDDLLSPSIAAAKALADGIVNNNPEGSFNPFVEKHEVEKAALEIDFDLQKQQSSEFDGQRSPREETPTPPADAVHDVGGLEDNVADSGEDSEDEWNYIKGEEANKENIHPTQPDQEVADILEDSENMSQLNPNAAEFVPVSPTRSIPSPACRSLINDPVIAQSPKRPSEIDINLPNPQDFENEVKSRPSDVDPFSNGHDNENDQKSPSKELQMENLLNGKNIDDIPEFQPGTTPTKVSSSDEFHFGPNAAPFTLTKLLDQSETGLSTKAVYGDESCATLGTSFDESVISQDNVDFTLLNKEQDPMSMSFYQDKSEVSDPFDLNKVHILPDNIDDFLNKPDEQKPGIIDETISDIASNDVILDNDERIQTTDLDKAVDDDKELASPTETKYDLLCSRRFDDGIDEFMKELIQSGDAKPRELYSASGISPDEFSPQNSLKSPEPNLLSQPDIFKSAPSPQPPKSPELSLSPQPPKSPEPSLSPQPPKSPEPSLSPQPPKSPEPSLSPQPAKFPETSLSPRSAKSPELAASPEIALSPEPVSCPLPAKSPEPVLCPLPAKSPEPDLCPLPEKSPEPVLCPLPAKSPEPILCPLPTKSPEPLLCPLSTKSPEPVLSPLPTESPEPLFCPLPAKSPEPDIFSEQVIGSPKPDIEPEQNICKLPEVRSPVPQSNFDTISFMLPQEVCNLPSAPELESEQISGADKKEEASIESPHEEVTSSVKDTSSPINSPLPDQVVSDIYLQEEGVGLESDKLGHVQEIFDAGQETIEASSPLKEDALVPDLCPISPPRSVTDTESVVTADVNSFLERTQISDVASPLSPNSEQPLVQDNSISDLKCDYPLPNEAVDIKTDNIVPEYAEPTIVLSNEPSKEEYSSGPSPLEEPLKELEVEKKDVGVAEVAVAAAAVGAVAGAAVAATTEKETPKAKTPAAAKKPAPKQTSATKLATSPTKAKTTPATTRPPTTSRFSASRLTTAPKTTGTTTTTSRTTGTTTTTSRTTGTTTTTSRTTGTTITASKTSSTNKTAATKPLPKPRMTTTSTSRTASSAATEKRPATNGDVKSSVRSTLSSVRKSTESTAAKTATKPLGSTTTKVSPTKSTAPRPLTAPSKPTTRDATGTSAPKPRPTTLSARTASATTRTISATTTTTKSTLVKSATSPKTATSPRPQPTTAAAAKPRVPLTKTITKTSADAEKLSKDSANKLTASRTSSTTAASKTATTGRTPFTSTVRKTEKTEAKATGTRTSLTKTTTTTTKSAITAAGKKPLEITRNVTKTKTTKIEKPVQNGISTVVTEQITVVSDAVSESEPLLQKDNSPIDNKLLVETNAAD